jgi:hypothetical protein
MGNQKLYENGTRHSMQTMASWCLLFTTSCASNRQIQEERSNLCSLIGVSSNLEYKHKQWDPGISQKDMICCLKQYQQILAARLQVAQNMYMMSSNRVDLTEPLLGGKQCFFGAVMSYPYMYAYSPDGPGPK